MSIFDIMSQQQSPSLGGTGGIGALGSGNAIYPQSRMDKTQYATPMQLPTSADVISSDYDPKTDAYTGMPNARFAQGGIASIPRFDGEDGSQVEAPSWNPESGQVKLQQYEDPKDPFSGVKSLVDYNIGKDQIKTFEPDIDLDTGSPTGSGRYILKDGSTMAVNNQGIVQAATPARSEYTLNKEGYYQPTGSGLEWRGDLNMLTKKIGGVDVQVPGMYHKGGYQDAQGKLRTDANGVPIALAPNYLDSGFGQSGLADAAPYIMAAALGGAGLAMAPGIAAGGFAGMVPASETLLGGLGAASTAAPLTTTELMGGAGGSFVPAEGASFALPEGLTSTTATQTLAPEVVKDIATSPTINTPQFENAINYYANATPQELALYSKPAVEAGGMTGTQKFLAASMAAKALGGSSSGGGGGGTYTTTTQAPPTQNIASNQYNPSMNYAAMSMPNMGYSAAPGAYYQPMTYRYYAQGGLADLGGYAAGGKLLKGDGDGMSDDIVANIEGHQPARLADGEFVIPADVVSHLGNGSTDAGAKQLYRMMDKIRQARTGNKKQGKRINPEKFFPKG